MQIKTPTQPLLNALSRVAPVCSNPLKAGNNDLTTGVLINVQDGRVCLKGYDHRTQIACSFEVPDGDCSAGDKALVVAPAFLTQLLRALPASSIVELTDDGGDMLHISTGASRFSARVRAVAPNEYPGPDETTGTVTSVTVPSGTLKGMLESTLFCASKENFREYLKTVRFKVSNGQLSVAALDGHRMALATAATTAVDGMECMFLLSVPAAAQLQKLAPDSDAPVTLRLQSTAAMEENDSNHPFSGLLSVDMGPTVVTTRLVTCKYPNIDGVMTSDEYLKNRLTLNRKELAAHIKSTAIFSNKRFEAVTLSVSRNPDTLKVAASNDLLGKASAQMDAQVDSMEDDSMELSFRAEYVKEILLALSTDEVALRAQPLRGQARQNIFLTPVWSGKEPPFDVRYTLAPLVM